MQCRRLLSGELPVSARRAGTGALKLRRIDRDAGKEDRQRQDDPCDPPDASNDEPGAVQACVRLVSHVNMPNCLHWCRGTVHRSFLSRVRLLTWDMTPSQMFLVPDCML